MLLYSSGINIHKTFDKNHFSCNMLACAHGMYTCMDTHNHDYTLLIMIMTIITYNSAILNKCMVLMTSQVIMAE